LNFESFKVNVGLWLISWKAVPQGHVTTERKTAIVRVRELGQLSLPSLRGR